MRLPPWLCTLAALCLVAADAKEDLKKEQAAFEGTWAVLSAERDGKADNGVKEDRLIIKGDQITIQSKGKENESASFSIDITKKPRTIDVKPKSEDVVVEGIYELKDGMLTICFARPGTDRPNEFKTREGSNRMLIVFKREKQ